jgi:hypothetical protein
VPGLEGEAGDILVEGETLQQAVLAATPDTPSDADIKQFYDQNADALTECHGAVYVLPAFSSFGEAQAMVQQIEDMEGDIDKVWQAAGAQTTCLQFVPAPIRDAVEEADIDAVVGPVAYGQAYYVLGRAHDFEPSFDFWKADIANALGNPQAALSFRKFLMTVRVSPQYGTWEGALLQVQGPPVPEPNNSRDGRTDDVLVTGDGTTG